MKDVMLNRHSWQILILVWLCLVFSGSSLAQVEDSTEGDDPLTEELPSAGDIPEIQQEMGQGEDFNLNQVGQSKDRAKPRPWLNRTYHLGVGAGLPQSIGNSFNHYEKLFGKPSWYPEFWGEYYFGHLWGIDVGVRTKLGYYSDTGYATGELSDPLPLERDLTDAEVDKSQESTLTLIPVQLSAVLSISPFKKRWVVIQGWWGPQWLYIQNTMQAKLKGQETSISQTPFLNSGWNQEQVFGASVSIDLSWLDPRSAYSMRVYGISGIYLTPFLEKVVTTTNNQGVYDRDVVGLMFTFEVVR